MRLKNLVLATHEGTNILGVGFLLMAGGIIFVGSRCADANELALQSFFVFSAAGFPGFFDFLWRYYATPQENWSPLILPSSGGALTYIPAWLFFAVFGFSMLSVALLREW